MDGGQCSSSTRKGPPGENDIAGSNAAHTHVA